MKTVTLLAGSLLLVAGLFYATLGALDLWPGWSGGQLFLENIPIGGAVAWVGLILARKGLGLKRGLQF